MIDRSGQLWEMVDRDGNGSYFSPKWSRRILVTESKDIGNGRTKQSFVYVDKDGSKGATGDDTEYFDKPWEMWETRKRIA